MPIDEVVASQLVLPMPIRTHLIDKYGAAFAAMTVGASGGLRDAIRRTTSAPPRQVTRRGSAQKRASAASSQHSNARFAEECQSILSNMIALCLPAILTPYGALLRISRIRIPPSPPQYAEDDKKGQLRSVRLSSIVRQRGCPNSFEQWMGIGNRRERPPRAM